MKAQFGWKGANSFSGVPEWEQARSKLERGRRIWLVLPAAVLAGLIGWAWTGKLLADEPEETRLLLGVRAEGGELRVSWVESGGALWAELEEVMLEVEQDGEVLSVDLREEYEAAGTVTVAMTAPQVAVRMRVQREGQPAVEQSVRYSAPALANRWRLWPSPWG